MRGFGYQEVGPRLANNTPQGGLSLVETSVELRHQLNARWGFVAFVDAGAIVPDPNGIITAGHDNQTARTVGFRRGETINAPALTAMFRQIIANNRAGGWRKLKRDG